MGRPLKTPKPMLPPMTRGEYTARVRAAIEEGLADVAAGRVYSDAEIQRWINSGFTCEPKMLRQRSRTRRLSLHAPRAAPFRGPRQRSSLT